MKSFPASKRYTLNIHENRWRKPWSINIVCTSRDYSHCAWIRLCALATCTESPWSNTTSCRTGGGIKFSFKVCRLSVPSHTIHYTAVKVNSHWHCHFYLGTVFRMQEAAMERITDTSLACFSVSSRRKFCLHCRHNNQHIPWVSTCFPPLKASQNITVPTVITSLVAVHQWSAAGEKENLVRYIMLSFNMQLLLHILEHFCSKLLTWKSRWFISWDLTSDFMSHQVPLKSLMLVSIENSVWHLSNTL